MNSTKKSADIRMAVVVAMNKLNKNPKPSKENINDNTGSSTTKSIVQVKTDVEIYSIKVFLKPLIFKSFFTSVKRSKCGSIYLPK
jgi:hypothetical protein